MHGLTIEQASWLVGLSKGTLRKSLAGLGLSDPVLDALLERGLIALTDGVVQVTSVGMAKVFRITKPDTLYQLQAADARPALGAAPRNLETLERRRSGRR